MGGNRGPQGSQGRWGKKASETYHSAFTEHRAQLTKSRKEEGFNYLYHTSIICEMVNPSIYKVERVVYASVIKKKKLKRDL